MIKKGVVMEVSKNSVGILTCGGEFIYVRKITPCPSLGEIYESEEVREKPLFYKDIKKLSAMIASLLIVFMLSSFIVVYNKPVSAVTININPSIKLQSNRWNNIIKVSALNKDGENILNNLSLRNKNLETGITLILKEAEKENYINDTYRNNNKTISIDFNGDVSKLNLTKIENTLKELKTKYNIKTPKYNKTKYKENINLDKEKTINKDKNSNSEYKNTIDKNNLNKDKNIFKVENSNSIEKNIKSSNKSNINDINPNNKQNKSNVNNNNSQNNTKNDNSKNSNNTKNSNGKENNSSKNNNITDNKNINNKSNNSDKTKIGTNYNKNSIDNSKAINKNSNKNNDKSLESNAQNKDKN